MDSFRTPSSFISEVPLAIRKEPSAGPLALAQTEDLPDIDDVIKKGQGFVDAGSVIAFTSNLKDEAKRDVLESTLFAQLAANAAADRLINPHDWYKQYQMVLNSVGWSIGSFTLIKQQFRKSRVEVSDAAMEILSAALGGLSLKVLETALESIRGLKDDDGIIELFDGSASIDTVANFQLGQATSDEDGNIDMPIGFFFFKSDAKIRKFLFVRWERKRISLFADAQLISLNRFQYDTHRKVVRERLTDATSIFVRQVPLSY